VTPFCWYIAPPCPGVAPDLVPLTPILTLNVPAGDYVFLASLTLRNQANFFLQNNGRDVSCQLTTALDPGSVFNWHNIIIGINQTYLDGFGSSRSYTDVALHTPVSFSQPTTVYLSCDAQNETDPNHVQVEIASAKVTAIKLGTMTRQ
jgi:hypothetical protein